MTSDEIKLGCLLFLMIMAGRILIPEKVSKKYPNLNAFIGILGGVVIAVVAFFALKGR